MYGHVKLLALSGVGFFLVHGVRSEFSFQTGVLLLAEGAERRGTIWILLCSFVRWHIRVHVLSSRGVLNGVSSNVLSNWRKRCWREAPVEPNESARHRRCMSVSPASTKYPTPRCHRRCLAPNWKKTNIRATNRGSET